MYTAFYKTGKFLITGTTSEDELKNVVENVILYINNYGINNTLKNVDIINMVFKDQFDFEIDLEKLIIELDQYDASYEPEQFPGLNFKDEHGITYLIFNSGKITITGVKSLNNLDEYVQDFKELIKEKSSI